MAEMFFCLRAAQIKPVHILMRHCGVLHFSSQKDSRGRGVKEPLGVCDGLGNSRVFQAVLRLCKSGEVR